MHQVGPYEASGVGLGERALVLLDNMHMASTACRLVTVPIGNSCSAEHCTRASGLLQPSELCKCRELLKGNAFSSQDRYASPEENDGMVDILFDEAGWWSEAGIGSRGLALGAVLARALTCSLA